MSSGLLGIEFIFPDWEGKIRAKRDEIDLFIAAMMQTNRGMLFDKSGAYNGHEPWAPLKFRNGQPLKLSGTLSKSMGPSNDGIIPGRGQDGILRFGGDNITIGTTLAYAELMNFGTTKMPGGVLKAKDGGALKIPLPPGKKANEATIAAFGTIKKKKDGTPYKNAKQKIEKGAFIFRKSVKIPERRFDTWTKEDQEELEAALTNKIMEILNG